MKKYRYNEKRYNTAINIVAEQVIAMSQIATADDDQDDVDYDLEVAVVDHAEKYLPEAKKDIEDRFNILI